MSVNYYEPPRASASTPTAAINTAAPVTPPVRKKSWLRRILSGIGASITFIRNTVFNLLFLLLVILLIGLFADSAPAPLPAQFILKVKPAGKLVDQYTYVDPASLLLSDEDSLPREVLLKELIDNIHAARLDDRVKAIHLDPSSISGDDLSKLAEVGQALTKFRESGKPIIAAAENYSQGQYYLASFADTIYLHELGMINLQGFARHGTYMYSALQKLGINVHTFRVGQFKDAVEPFLRDDMSEQSREHNQEWVSMLWQDYTQQIETTRKLNPGELTALINNLHVDLREFNGDMAAYLVDKKLIDNSANLRDLKNVIDKQVGRDEHNTKFPRVDYEEYALDQMLKITPPADQIALIVASGSIVEGDEPDGSIGSDTVIKKLRTAFKDDQIKAVVLRIDSGGGSAYASDLIYQEIAHLRKKGKPVYVSMGRYAASGGYYIAAGADQIWAQPNTLTGSIGVFGMTATFENALDKLHLHTDGVTTTDIASSNNSMLPLPDKTSQILQQSVEFLYQRFIGIVAEGRDQTPEQIDAIAQGRVWTGSKALQLGLVDKLGSLQDTLDAAAAHLNLETYEVRVIERERSAKEELFHSLASSQIGALAPLQWLGKFTQFSWLQPLAPAATQVEQLLSLRDKRGVLAYCITCAPIEPVTAQ